MSTQDKNKKAKRAGSKSARDNELTRMVENERRLDADARADEDAARKLAEIDAQIARTSDPIATDILYKERDRLVKTGDASAPTIPPCEVCGGILSHKDGCRFTGRRVEVQAPRVRSEEPGEYHTSAESDGAFLAGLAARLGDVVLLVRTSEGGEKRLALTRAELERLDKIAYRWDVSRSEAIRRAGH